LPPYPEAQITAVIELIGDILKRNRLTPERVVGHSDIAPARKDDPGEHFPWQRLADAGVSVWPDVEAPAKDRVLLKHGDRGARVHDLHACLAELGYDAPEDADAASSVFNDTTQSILRAFQRRFEPQRIDGQLWATTWEILDALLEMRDEG